MKTFFAVLWLFGLSFPLPGQVLLKEDFSKKGKFPEDNRTYYFNGVYHVYSHESVRLFDPSKNFKDFTAEIRTEFISGATAAFYGLYFRHDRHMNGYSFLITSWGYYNLHRTFQKPNGEVDSENLTSGTADSVFNKKGVNYLKTECKGDTIRLYINGHKVQTVTDSVIPEGIIGIYVWKDLHVHFDDLTVYKKNVTGKYSFKPVFPDSAFDEKSDSKTINLINFNKFTGWKDIPGAFHENGLYRIDSSAYINNYIYNYVNTDFSIRANLKIREWPRHGELRLSWYPDQSDYETEIGIIGDSTLRYVNKPAGIRNTLRNFPFRYETGTFVRLQIDKKDGDTKISVNGHERIVIIDESYEPRTFNWIEFRTEGIGIDLYSIKISKHSDEEYGIGTKDLSCPVIRVSGNLKTAKKPPVEDESDRIPEDDSSFFSNLFLTIFSNYFLTIILIGASQILLIWGIVRWRNAVRYNATHFVDYIRERNGSFFLNEFSARFRFSLSKAAAVMDKMVKDYGGYRYPVKDENDAFYDFPTFMSDVPKPVTVGSYPDFIERMISAYAKRIGLPESAARFYFLQICTLAAHLQGRLSVHTVNKKIEEGSFILDRAHFSPYKTTWDIVILLMSEIIDDERYIRILSDDTPAVLKFHEDVIKHFQNQ